MSNTKENKEEVELQNEETQEQTQEQTQEETIVELTTEELVAQEKDKFLRLFAEFENYKKRTSKERIELFKTAGKDILTSLLPILDDFERALSHIEENKETKEIRDGVLLIYQKLCTTVEQKGLTAVETKAGDTFDADIHEAITQIPAPTDDMKGKIIDVIEKGYQLGDKIIRFPKVVIGQL